MAVKEQIAGLLAWGVDGAAFGPRTAVALTTTSITSISQGFWLVETLGAGQTSIQFTPDAGTTTVTYIASAAKTTLYSDGFSWWANNTTTASSVTLTQIKSMF